MPEGNPLVAQSKKDGDGLFVADRAHAMLEAGGIVMAAGHDHEMLERFCGRALWLESGAVRADGPFEEVRSAYLEAA